MIELRPDMRIDFTGKQIEFGQWQLWIDGSHVAYLNHQPNSEIQPCRVNFPADRMEEIVKACEAERERLGKPSKVLPTPDYNLRFIECNKVLVEQQASEDDDE